MEKSSVEISSELLDLVRRLAGVQERSETEVFEEAVVRYLLFLRELSPGGWPDDIADVGGKIQETRVADLEDRRHSVDELFERIDRGQRKRGVEPLSEEDAMRLADEELHAMRREQRAGR